MVGGSILRGLYALLVALSLLIVLCAADAVSDLQTKGRAAVDAEVAKSTTCTKDKLQVRKEWGDITSAEKKAYIAAVLCITKAPSQLPATSYPGAKSRYDDFVAIHMKNTMSIHGTVGFTDQLSLTQSLISPRAISSPGTDTSHSHTSKLCGRSVGTMALSWDWGRWASSPETSPIFDGSDTSMSGQGEKVAHNSNGMKPAGNGGGCISGPFKDMKVNLGPMAALGDTSPPKNPRSDGYGYNPRCIKRDISNYLSQRDASTAKIAALISGQSTIANFQNQMQSGTGVHPAGHFTISGDPGSDFYVSPGDPAFWLHHSMIDRVWHIWQTQDFSKRQQVIAGGTSMMGGGKAATLNDGIDLEVLNVGGKKYAIKDLVSTVAGPLCYVYE